MLRLVRDVLDKQLIDRKGRKCGRVDGLVIRFRQDQPPRVEHIEVGSITLARRLHPRLGKWMLWLQKKWKLHDAGSYRIPMEKVIDVGTRVKVNVDAGQTPLMKWENWVRDNIIGRIPGA